jgi:HK97 gp10 family phage protein
MSVHSEWNGEKLNEKIRIAQAKASDRAGQYVIGLAVLLCPVLTGNLRSSLTYIVSLTQSIVRIGSAVDYAPHVEYGTSSQSAQPYLRPALAHKEEIKTIYAEEYKAAMK